MLSRQEALGVLDAAYRARVAGDKEALGRHWANGAHFEIVGNARHLSKLPLTAGPPMQALDALIDRFSFSDFEIVDAVMEGNKLAARSRVTVEVAGKAPERTELFDLVEFDEVGKIRSFTQFADTALIREMAT